MYHYSNRDSRINLWALVKDCAAAALAALLVTILAAPAAAQSTAQTAELSKESAAQGSVTLSLRLHDKKIYFPGMPIWVDVRLANTGAETYHFRLAEDHAFSLAFEARRPDSRPVEAAEAFMRRAESNRQVFFRDIALDAGETFSFIEDITQYCALDKPGSYLVTARLFPDLERSSISTVALTTPAEKSAAQKPALVSNRLTITVAPPSPLDEAGVPVFLDTATNAALVRSKMPPDEVVAYALRARQKEEWEKFFLYMDLEAMLTRDGARNRQWRAESEEGRQKLLARYRGDLQKARIEGDIATIPKEFVIEQTTYNADKGQVVVTEKFQTGAYTEVKRFTYFLQLKEGIWTIIDYNVINIGIE